MGRSPGVGNRAARGAGLGLMLLLLLAAASPPHTAETWVDAPGDTKAFADRCGSTL
jgi:hypothetical protein